MDASGWLQLGGGLLELGGISLLRLGSTGPDRGSSPKRESAVVRAWRETSKRLARFLRRFRRDAAANPTTLEVQAAVHGSGSTHVRAYTTPGEMG